MPIYDIGGVKRGEKNSDPKWVFWYKAVFSFIMALQLGWVYVDVDSVTGGGGEWPSEIKWFIDAVNYLKLNFSEEGFIALYCTVTIVMICFILGVVLSQCECCSCLQEWGGAYEGSSLKLHSYIYGLFFIPICQILMQVWNCSNGFLVKAPSLVVCWGSAHVGLVVLFFPAAVLFLGGAVVTLIVNDRSAHYHGEDARLRRSVRYFFARHAAYRIAMAAVGVYSNKANVDVALALYLVSFLPIGHLLLYLPHLEAKYNALLALNYSICNWSLLVGFVALSGPAANISLLFFLGVVFYSAMAVGCVVVYSTSCRPPSDEDFAALTHKGKPSVAEALAEMLEVSAERLVALQTVDHGDLWTMLHDEKVTSRTDLHVLVIQKHKEAVDDGLAPSESEQVVKQLADIVQANPEMQLLVVTDQNFSKTPCSLLFASVVNHPALKKLDFFSSRLTDSHALDLYKQLRDSDNSSITFINFGGNSLSDQVREKLKKSNRAKFSC